MLPLASEWSIVIAGSWNLAILNPEWLAKKIFCKDEVEVELVLVGTRPTIRIRSGNVVFFPSSTRVSISCKEASAAALEEVEAVAVKVLKELPVTPLSGIGVNFAFRAEAPTEALLDCFNLNDGAKLSASGPQILSTGITRAFDDDGNRINYSMELGEDRSVTLKFNFHTPVSDGKEAISAIEKLSAVRLERAEKIIGEVYELSVEESE